MLSSLFQQPQPGGQPGQNQPHAQPMAETAEWRTGRSFSKAIISALPSESVLRAEESKQARALLELLPEKIKELPYQDFSLLMGMATSFITECSQYHTTRRELAKLQTEWDEHPDPNKREQLADRINHRVKEFAHRPRSFSERLQEHTDALISGANVWRKGVSILSPAATAALEMLCKLSEYDAQMRPQMLAKKKDVFSAPIDELFANEILRLLRLSFPGGVNVRNPALKSPGQGVFQDFESLEIGIGDHSVGVKLTPCQAGYRYEVTAGRGAQATQGVLFFNDAVLCGRPGGVPFSIAGVDFSLPSAALITEIPIEAERVSRAAIEICALKSGGVVVVNRGSRHPVVYRMQECQGKWISGIHESRVCEDGLLGETREQEIK